MTAVWYDAYCDQIWVESHEAPFAPRTLVAVVDAAGLIHIRHRGQGKTLAGGAYSDFTDADGKGFGSNDEALGYLGEVFSRAPARGDAFVVPVQIAQAGQTVLPLPAPPAAFETLRCEVNGVAYRVPDIAVSDVAVTWADPAFSLDPSDRVTVAYS